MPRKLDSVSQIGRRLSLRDLHLFFTVVQHGSMVKTASQFGISQPNVSEAIDDREHNLRARLHSGLRERKHDLLLQWCVPPFSPPAAT